MLLTIFMHQNMFLSNLSLKTSFFYFCPLLPTGFNSKVTIAIGLPLEMICHVHMMCMVFLVQGFPLVNKEGPWNVPNDIYIRASNGFQLHHLYQL